MDAAPNESNHQAFKRAVHLAGGQSALQRQIGMSQQRASYRLARRFGCPAEHVLKVEAATGVSRHDLRPDLYPREPATLDRSAA